MIAHILDTPRCQQYVKCIEFTLILESDKNQRKQQDDAVMKPKIEETCTLR
jgi:hypothetical protein